MEKGDRINLVIAALKSRGYNDDLVADGEVGQQAIIACGEFLKGEGGCNGACTAADINPVIKALKEAGFNNALKEDGDVGGESVKAIKAFLLLGLTG